MTDLKRKTGNKKMLLMIPLALGSVFSFAKTNPDIQRIKKGDETIFKGHHFYWCNDRVDSVEVEDRTTHKKTTKIYKPGPQVNKMDKETVFAYESVSVEPKFQDDALADIDDYIKEKFKDVVPEDLDTISQVTIANVVVDAKGKIMYYDLSYLGVTKANSNIHQSSTTNERLDPIMDKIIADCPPIVTNMKDGKPVPTYFRFLTKVSFKPVSFRFKAVPVQQK